MTTIFVIESSARPMRELTKAASKYKSVSVVRGDESGVYALEDRVRMQPECVHHLTAVLLQLPEATRGEEERTRLLGVMSEKALYNIMSNSPKDTHVARRKTYEEVVVCARAHMRFAV